MKLQIGILLLVLCILFLTALFYKEGFADAVPNPNLIVNDGGPAWRQFVVDSKLLPSDVTLGKAIKVGPADPISISPTDAGNFIGNVTYRLGDIITYKGARYICLAWTDARGPAFSGTYNVTPEQDKNAWFKIIVLKPGSVQPVVTEQTIELDKKLNQLMQERSNTSSVVSPYVRRTDISSPSDINAQFEENIEHTSESGLPGVSALPAIDPAINTTRPSELLDPASPCLEGSEEARDAVQPTNTVEESKPAKCENTRRHATRCKLNLDKYKYYFDPTSDC